MKYTSYLIVFLLLAAFNSNAQFIDDFSDGDFTNNPTWVGEEINYTVNANLQLQLNSAGTASPYLSSAFNYNVTGQNSEWQFYIRLNFSPSNNNYARVYLMSNNSNLNDTLSGYYLRFGENNALDAIELYRQDGSAVTRVLRGTDASIANSFEAVVKVIRDSNGEWSLFTDYANQGTFTLEAQAVDANVVSMQHLGVVCYHTTTNRTNFFFDNFYAGIERVDNDPPIINSVRPLSNNTLEIIFDEPVEKSTAESLNNYTVDNGIGNPQVAIQTINPRIVELTFANNFQNRQPYNITIQFVEDLNGNAMPRVSLPFIFFVPQIGDIVFNELFPDPTPVVGLPEHEFVELYNRSGVELNLAGWKFSDPGAIAVLPDFTIPANGYVILCPLSVVSQFQSFGPTIGLSPWPTLNNSSDQLSLSDPQNNLIDFVSYSDSWYQNTTKRDGGWTLERINPDDFCAEGENWIASNDPTGGTPGRINSVFGVKIDTMPPLLVSYNVLTPTEVRLVFSERLDVASAQLTNNYIINQGVGSPISVTLEPIQRRDLLLTFSNPLQVGVIYGLTISNISDCAGNQMQSIVRNIGIPQIIAPKDIIINELLAYPRTGSSRFIEIYNNSNKVLDLQQLQLASGNSNDEIDRTYAISTQPSLFPPGEYRVITNNAANILANYQVLNPENILVIPTFPAYASQSGRAILHLNDSVQTRIDQFNYQSKMHFRLIDDQRGISLERIDFNQPTNNASNWFSAAATAGFATPTYENSQRKRLESSIDKLVIEPKTFSPNGDGYNDLLFIKYNFETPGFVASCYIFDAGGRMVKTLFKSETLAPDGVYTWDGTLENGTKARIGAYVLYFEAFDLSGNVERIKKGFVIGGLN